MAATLWVWGMSAAPAEAEGLAGAWVADPRFTFLKMGYCVRIYRCVAPGQIQAGARPFTASPSEKQQGLCVPGVDSLDYCGLCQTDAPKEPCTYDRK